MLKLGLIAKDIHNSVSPIVYETLGEAVGTEVSYEILNIPEEKLEEAVEYGRKHWDGFNVTMPYKQSVLKYMDEIDESAKNCESTNTVSVKNGKLTAYNTDGWGFIKALQMEGYDFTGKKVVLVGAGGVAFSIAYNLRINRVELVEVVNLIPEQTQRLCEKFGPRFLPHSLSPEILSECSKDADLFINASVLGQVGYDDYKNFDFLDGLKKNACVFDVNYSNPDALLLKKAAEKGMAVYKGSCMTACQGIRVMQIWSGKTPDEETVRKLAQKLSQ